MLLYIYMFFWCKGRASWSWLYERLRIFICLGYYFIVLCTHATYWHWYLCPELNLSPIILVCSDTYHWLYSVVCSINVWQSEFLSLLLFLLNIWLIIECILLILNWLCNMFSTPCTAIIIIFCIDSWCILGFRFLL